MGFAGELRTIQLPDIFRNVAFNGLTGVLTVTDDSMGVLVYFEGGKIRAYGAGPNDPFDYETVAERAGASLADILRARSRRRRCTLKQALAGAEGFDAESFDEGVSAMVREAVVQLLRHQDASFVFDENPPATGLFDDEQFGCAIAIDANKLILEFERREDAWFDISASIGSEDEILLAKDGAHPGNLSPSAEALLAQLDGTCDLGTALASLPFGRAPMLRLLAQLLEAGVVVRADADHLCEMAQRERRQGEINRAAQLLAMAIQRDPDDMGPHRDMAELYEQAGRKSEAALACKRLAAVHERRGDIQGAIVAYHRAADLAPHDIDTLERIASIHEARGDARAHMQAGRRLADTHIAQGRYDAALSVLQDLLRHDPQSIPVRESIAATYIKMHEPKNAATELLSLAESACAANGYHRALHYYRSVLAVDRNCSVAALRVDEIESRRLRIRRRSRRRRLAAAVLALVLGFPLWQGAREVLAQRALNRAAQAGVGTPAQEAIMHYIHVFRDYPQTQGADQAVRMVRALLVVELNGVRALLPGDPDRAERTVRQLGRISYPDGVRDFWRGARHRLLRRIDSQRATSTARR